MPASKSSFTRGKKYRTSLPAGRHQIRNQPAGRLVLNNEVKTSVFKIRNLLPASRQAGSILIHP
jgi:hypothetical protein